MPTSIFFNQLLICMNLHQYAKNHTFSSFCSRDTFNLKILQSDWSRVFSPICHELDFSQVWDLCKNTANIIKFLYRPVQKKLMTKFSNKFKKHCFWPIFPIFVAKKFFSRKSSSVMHNFIWVSSAIPKFRKSL